MLVRCLLYPFDYREAAYNGYSQQIHIVDDGYLVLNCKESVFAEAECSFEECAELAQLLKIEYAEADDYNKLAVDMADNNGYLLHALLADEHFDEYENTVVKPPYDEVPACAVPYARAEPYEEKSAVLSALAEYRDIEDIVAEECAEGDMPALPEFRDIPAYERVVEVLIEMESEDTSQTYCDIGIA